MQARQFARGHLVASSIWFVIQLDYCQCAGGHTAWLLQENGTPGVVVPNPLMAQAAAAAGTEIALIRDITYLVHVLLPVTQVPGSSSLALMAAGSRREGAITTLRMQTLWPPVSKFIISPGLMRSPHAAPGGMAILRRGFEPLALPLPGAEVAHGSGGTMTTAGELLASVPNRYSEVRCPFQAIPKLGQTRVDCVRVAITTVAQPTRSGL
jgi:hypothetical protein